MVLTVGLDHKKGGSGERKLAASVEVVVHIVQERERELRSTKLMMTGRKMEKLLDIIERPKGRRRHRRRKGRKGRACKERRKEARRLQRLEKVGRETATRTAVRPQAWAAPMAASKGAE